MKLCVSAPWADDHDDHTATVPPTQVFYNGRKLAVRDFAQYVDMYLGPKDGGAPRFYERVNDRWEVVVSMSDGQFEQVSFVNAIATTKGGTHVNSVESQVTKHVLEVMTKKHKQVMHGSGWCVCGGVGGKEMREVGAVGSVWHAGQHY